MKQSSFSISEVVFLIFAFCLTIWIVAYPSISINNANVDSQKVIDQTDFKRSAISIVKDKISKVDDIVVNTINATSSQELIVTPKGNNDALDYNILLVLLSLTTLLSISVSFWLYRWRRIATSGREIVVPEIFAQQLQSIYASINYSNSKVGDAITQQRDKVDQQSSVVNQSRNSLALLGENIKEMIEVHMKLQSVIDQKENEIERYKQGYDAKIFHDFLLRFTIVDQVFKDYIRDDKTNKDVKDALEDIREVMEDALAECGVESFSPEIGDDYRSVEGVADNPKKIDTDNEDQHYSIKEVIDEGYRRETDGGDYKIITEARVSIYIYKKSEEDNSNTIQE